MDQPNSLIAIAAEIRATLIRDRCEAASATRRTPSFPTAPSRHI
jgi:hypothetical protein